MIIFVLFLLLDWPIKFIFMGQDLVDVEVFHEAKRVIDALQNKEVAPALAWCAENKSRLKKSKV